MAGAILLSASAVAPGAYAQAVGGSGGDGHGAEAWAEGPVGAVGAQAATRPMAATDTAAWRGRGGVGVGCAVVDTNFRLRENPAS